jgi:hypothetical protein
VSLVRVPFYFINLLPTSLLYISILLVHQHIILDDDKANQSLKEAWEQENNEDELEDRFTRPQTAVLVRNMGGTSRML